jgi:3-oxoacyl-[acyl-carrier-protein] synthase-3
LKIIGTGSAVPARVVTNDELALFLDTSDEWIRTRTGIRTRRVMTDETLDQLALQAAQGALADAGAEAGSLDFLLCSTVQGEWVTPGLGCALQGMLGAECPSVDLNGACAGFLYALDMADCYIKAGKAKRILIVCAEAMSRVTDWTDRSTCVLFGDAAAAVVVEEGEGLLATRLTTRGNTEVLRMRANSGNCPYQAQSPQKDYIHMQGQDVYRFAVSASSDDLKKVIAAADLTPDDIHHYLLHQANMRILEAVRARLKQPPERFPHNIERTGNTSSASVPLLLDELNREGRLKTGDLLAMSAFGAGLVTGACVLKWTKGK